MSPKLGVAPVRRAAIVQATIRCLARDGYAGLTMKRVAAEAGVSPGILHYYFRDKRAILAEAAARVTRELDHRVAAESRGARNAHSRLRALCRACLDAATRNRDIWTVFIEFWGQTLHDRQLRALNARTYARARRLLASAVTRGVAEEVFRPVNPEEAAVVILAVLDGLSLQLTFDRSLMSTDRAVRLGEETLLGYLTAAGTRPRARRPRAIPRPDRSKARRPGT